MSTEPYLLLRVVTSFDFPTPVGFLADTEEGYANCLAAALNSSDSITYEIRKHAREASKTFSDAIFADAIIKETGEFLFPTTSAKQKKKTS